MEKDRFVPMGNIVGVFGIKGWVKIKCDTDDEGFLRQYGALYLFVNENYRLYDLEDSFVRNRYAYAKFKGVDDRDTAMGLRGVTVNVLRDNFPVLEDGEYYWVDLIGLSVCNVIGKTLGLVVDLVETGANVVLVVGEEPRILIPFVGIYVIDVDLKRKKIIVDWELDY